MKEFKYIEAANGGRFVNIPCTMTTTMQVELSFKTYGYPDGHTTGDGHFFVLGGNGGDVVLRGQDQDQYWWAGGEWFVGENIWTLNDWHTCTWSSSQYTFDENTYNTTGGVRNGSQQFSINSRDVGVAISKIKVTDGGVVVNEFVGAEDNGVVGLWDKTNDIFYEPTSGTWVGVENFEPSQDSFAFDATGGSETFTVEADNSWTAATPTYFSVSPLSGSAGTTTVTVTAGVTAGARSETVTFTDSETNTFDISISQSGDGSLFPFAKIIRGTTRIN